MAFWEDVELDFAESLGRMYAVPNVEFDPMYSEAEETPCVNPRRYQHSVDSNNNNLSNTPNAMNMVESKSDKMGDKTKYEVTKLASHKSVGTNKEKIMRQAEDGTKLSKLIKQNSGKRKAEETGCDDNVDRKRLLYSRQQIKQKKEADKKNVRKNTEQNLGTKAVVGNERGEKKDTKMKPKMKIKSVVKKVEKDRKFKADDAICERRHSRTKVCDGGSRNRSKRRSDEREKREETPDKKKIGEDPGANQDSTIITRLNAITSSHMNQEESPENSTSARNSGAIISNNCFEEETEYFILDELSSEDNENSENRSGLGDSGLLASPRPKELSETLENKEEITCPLKLEKSSLSPEKDLEVIKEVIVIPDETSPVTNRKLSLDEYKAKYMPVKKRKSNAISETVVRGNSTSDDETGVTPILHTTKSIFSTTLDTSSKDEPSHNDNEARSLLGGQEINEHESQDFQDIRVNNLQILGQEEGMPTAPHMQWENSENMEKGEVIQNDNEIQEQLRIEEGGQVTSNLSIPFPSSIDSELESNDKDSQVRGWLSESPRLLVKVDQKTNAKNQIRLDLTADKKQRRTSTGDNAEEVQKCPKCDLEFRGRWCKSKMTKHSKTCKGKARKNMDVLRTESKERRKEGPLTPSQKIRSPIRFGAPDSSVNIIHIDEGIELIESLAQPAKVTAHAASETTPPRPRGRPGADAPPLPPSNLPIPPNPAHGSFSNVQVPGLPSSNALATPRVQSQKMRTTKAKRVAGRKTSQDELSRKTSSFRKGFLDFTRRQKLAQALTLKVLEGEIQGCRCKPHRKSKISKAMGKLAYTNSRTFAELLKKYSGQQD